jgi:hypothetical protein
MADNSPAAAAAGGSPRSDSSSSADPHDTFRQILRDGGSPIVSDPPGRVLPFVINACEWRSWRLGDDECRRYFDCPSHQLERDTPIVDVEEEEGERGPP